MYCNYDAITQCFSKVSDFALTLDKTPRIIMPRIGAGLAGGEWKWIRNVSLPNALNPCLDVYTYTLIQGLNEDKQKLLKDFLDFYEPTGFYDYDALLWQTKEDYDRIKNIFNHSRYFHAIETETERYFKVAGITIKQITTSELYDMIQLERKDQ